MAGAGAAGAGAVGLMVAFGVAVASGVGLADSALVPRAVPPPTPPVPDGKAVAFEDDGASLAEHPESETSKSAAMAQPLTVLTVVAGSLDRRAGKCQCARQVSNVAMPRRASLMNPASLRLRPYPTCHAESNRLAGALGGSGITV